jgi:Leucine-rich repeat (LRR) protein
MDQEKLSILSKFFPKPRPAFIYTLFKVPVLAPIIDKQVKELIMPTFVQNDFLEQFPVFTNLEVLTIEVPEARDSGVIRLIQGSSQTLTKITLNASKITAATLEELQKCPNLEWLSLDNCQFAENPFDTLLAVLKATKVTQLFIKNVPHLTEQQIGELISVRAMTRLGFRKTDLLSVELFKVLQDTPSLGSSLIRLDLENFDQLNVDHIVALLKAFQSLKAISFLDGNGIEAQFAPLSMSLKHPSLEELILPTGT